MTSDDKRLLSVISAKAEIQRSVYYAFLVTERKPEKNIFT